MLFRELLREQDILSNVNVIPIVYIVPQLSSVTGWSWWNGECLVLAIRSSGWW